MNKFILERLFNIYAKDIQSTEELANLTSKLQTKLHNGLDNENLVLFSRYEYAKTEELELLMYESFKRGFRASVMLMFEATQD